MQTIILRSLHRVAAIGTFATLAACGGSSGDAGASGAAADTPSSASAAEAPGVATPDAGGRVIEIEMLTDVANAGANIFRPAAVEAKRGDVLRYKLVSGVHNVSFPADSNAAMGTPPAASPMLQAPGQTYDVKVTWGPGSYFFQCDPHALLGMVGRLTVIQ